VQIDARPRASGMGFASRPVVKGRGPGRGRRTAIRIGLIIPLRGAAGIWGPSSEACARLAAADLNAASGLLDAEVDLVVIDAGGSRPEIAAALRRACGSEAIDALVGMHPSDLRAFVTSNLPPDLPYIYTPLYEGGETAANVFAIGETPDRLLQPGIAWLAENRRAQRWFMVGNDYVWPRMMHRVARDLVLRHGGSSVGEAYFPFGARDFDAILAGIRLARPDVVLMSIIGEDAVAFNRAFAEAGLAARMLRFSTAVEENVIYGIGPEMTENMYLTAGYFAHLRSAENDAFRERYHAAFGEAPPMQNDLGESCYEGVHYLAALVTAARSTSARALKRALPAMAHHRSARFAGQGAERSRKVHVAAVEGLEPRLLQSR
jgi:urea transport system substrate-binding protein